MSYNFIKGGEMEIIKKCFGEQLKTCRKIKNLTQEKLAEMIGINIRQLARIESGESFVTAETLYNLCSVLEISPKLLFDFNIEDETLMTGSGSKVHLKVVKNGNLMQLVNSNNYNDYNNPNNFDNRMLKIAQNINKEIIVEEIKNGLKYQTKIYKPDGNIEIINNDSEEENYNTLINNIEKIKNDKNKINYMSLAYNSLNNKTALDELKSVIKGIELTFE